MAKATKILLASLAMAAATFAAGTAAAVNLVTCGAFCTGTFAAWTDQGTGPVDVVTSTSAITGPIPAATYFAQLGGVGTGSYTNGSLAQTIHDGGGPVTGYFYINFADAKKGDIFTVRWDNSNILTLSCGKGKFVCGDDKWIKIKNIDLTGHGTDPLSFNFNTKHHEGDYFGLDFVYLNGIPAVPEPATWTLMLAGFGGLGAALRSRRRVALANT